MLRNSLKNEKNWILVPLKSIALTTDGLTFSQFGKSNPRIGRCKTGVLQCYDKFCIQNTSRYNTVTIKRAAVELIQQSDAESREVEQATG